MCQKAKVPHIIQTTIKQLFDTTFFGRHVGRLANDVGSKFENKLLFIFSIYIS